MNLPRAARAPMRQLEVNAFDAKIAFLKANLRPTPEQIAAHKIDVTESGLIKLDKSIASLIGLSAPQLTRVRMGEDDLPARAAAELLRLFGLDCPDAIDARDHSHLTYLKLLQADMDNFIVELRTLGADIPSTAPAVGDLWNKLVRIADQRNATARNYIALNPIDRARDLPVGPTRCLPPGVSNVVKPRDFPVVKVGERISYVVGLAGFEPSVAAGEVHLCGFHSGVDSGRPLHVPMLPTPWGDVERDGPLNRKWSLAVEIPHRPNAERCFVVSGEWGPTISAHVLVTRTPMDDHILRVFGSNERLDAEFLDLIAARLMDQARRPAGSWTLLRTSFNVADAPGGH